MADHVPRLCEDCGRPLSAREKRIDFLRCWFHRELFITRKFNEALERTGRAGAWADGGLD